MVTVRWLLLNGCGCMVTVTCDKIIKILSYFNTQPMKGYVCAMVVVTWLRLRLHGDRSDVSRGRDKT